MPGPHAAPGDSWVLFIAPLESGGRVTRPLVRWQRLAPLVNAVARSGGPP